MTDIIVHNDAGPGATINNTIHVDAPRVDTDDFKPFPISVDKLIAAGVVIVILAAVLGVTALFVQAQDNYTGRTGGGDAEFLSIIHTHTTLTVANSDAAAKAGHSECEALELGASRHDIAASILYYHQGASSLGVPDWSDTDAGWLITASVVAYCPKFIVASDQW